MAARLRNLTSGARAMLGILSRRWVLGGPRLVSTNVTGICNTNCVMCIAHSPTMVEARKAEDPLRPVLPSFPKEHMDPAVFETIVRECGKAGTYQFVICGAGEPTLHPEFDRLLDLAVRFGMLPYVVTNGLGVDEGRAKAWAATPAHFRFSVHAGDLDTWLRVHPAGTPGQSERLSQPTRTLAAGAPHVTIMHVIQKANFRHVREMIEQARELGARELRFEPVRGDGPIAQVLLDPDEEAELRRGLVHCLELAQRYGIRSNLRACIAHNLYTRGGSQNTQQLYQRIPCYAGWIYAAFKRDGTVIPCGGSKRVMGRVGEQNLRDIWRSPAWRAFRREARALPRRTTPLEGCYCHACYMNLFNTTIYDLLHPLRCRAHGGVRS